MAEGDYCVTVTIQNGCESNGLSSYINCFTIVKECPSLQSLGVTFTKDEPCPNCPTCVEEGSITINPITPKNPKNPFQFVWENGVNGLKLAPIKPGTYKFKITDPNTGCTWNDMAVLSFASAQIEKIKGENCEYKIKCKEKSKTIDVGSTKKLGEDKCSYIYTCNTDLDLGNSVFSYTKTGKQEWQEKADCEARLVCNLTGITLKSFFGESTSTTNEQTCIKRTTCEFLNNAEIPGYLFDDASEEYLGGYCVKRLWALDNEPIPENEDGEILVLAYLYGYEVHKFCNNVVGAATSGGYLQDIAIIGLPTVQKDKLAKLLNDYGKCPISGAAKVATNHSTIPSFSNSLTTLKVTPNPFYKSIMVDFNSKNSQFVSISLTNVLGQMIQTQQNDAVEGINQFSFSINAPLKNGIYFLLLEDEKKNKYIQKMTYIQE